MTASDPFASQGVSIVLAWVSTVPLLLGGVSALINALSEKVEGFPRWFVLWVVVCLVVLSPVRYIFLQVLMAAAFPMQSWRAFFSTLLLALYVPIVFSIMLAIGVILPLLASCWAAFGSIATPKITRLRLVLGTLLAPVLMMVCYPLFLWALTYASMTTHWLDASDVVGATNGPAMAAYSVGLKHLMPMPVPGYLTSVTRTDRDMLRNHVAGYYLGWSEHSRYVHLAFPAVYDSLMRSRLPDR